MLKAIHAQESKKASREKARAVVAELKAMKLPEAAKKVEDSIDETLTYCEFPLSIGRRFGQTMRLSVSTGRSGDGHGWPAASRTVTQR